MAQDSTSSILKHLSTFSVHFEGIRFRLKEFFVFGRANSLFATILREDPSPCWSGIENNLHLLWWITELESTFITHVFEIYHGDINFCMFWSFWLIFWCLDHHLSVFSFDNWPFESLSKSQSWVVRNRILVLLISTILIFNLRQSNRNHRLSIFFVLTDYCIWHISEDVDTLSIRSQSDESQESSNCKWFNFHLV